MCSVDKYNRRERGITFNMFWDEVIGKLRTDAALASFSVTVLGRAGVAVSGVKGVVYSSDEEVRVRLRGGALTVRGEELVIAEIGGGDVLVRGKVKGVELD